MKKLFIISSFFYSATSFCQHKLPFNIQNKEQGTYLIRINTLTDSSDDSATLYIRIFELGESGTKEIEKGAVIINDNQILLEKEPNVNLLTPVRIKSCKLKITASGYDWLIPLTTKKLVFKKGYSYSISFFLVRTYPFEE